MKINKKTISSTVFKSSKYLTTIYIVSAFLATSLAFCIKLGSDPQQFTYYAHSLLNGNLHLIDKGLYGSVDTVLWEGKYYFPLSIFPALLILPFEFLSLTFFGKHFLDVYLHIFLNFGVYFLVFKLARQFKYSVRDSLILAIGYLFSSTYSIVAYIPWVWYFAHTITTFFTLLALLEYFNRRRYWLIGVFMSFVFATRATAGLGMIFFIFAIILSKDKQNIKFKNLLYLLMPSLFWLALFMHLNYIRFGNMLDNGYKHANNFKKGKYLRYELENYGLFKLRNIVTNFYYYFIKTLDPVTVSLPEKHTTYILHPPYVKVKDPGTSFFVNAPLYLYVFKSKLKNIFEKHALITTFVILFFLLSYYWTGWVQIGPRYTNDFLPFLTLILFSAIPGKKLNKKIMVLIYLSALFNLYLILALDFF